MFFLVEGMYTCKTGYFGNNPLCLCLSSYRVMYTCKTGNFGNVPLHLCFCFFREYVHI